MPKDEFDPADPMELSGLVLLTEEDTTGPMCECFVEEFMRLGYGPDQVLALFRKPEYLGPSMVWQKRGEAFIRHTITAVFARWGRPVRWSGSAPAGALEASRRLSESAGDAAGQPSQEGHAARKGARTEGVAHGGAPGETCGWQGMDGNAT